MPGAKPWRDLLAAVDVIALSGTTPGFTAMDAEGRPLYPAILMLDQRSRQQARQDHRCRRHEAPSGRDGEHARRRRVFAGKPPLDQRQSPGDLQEIDHLRPFQHLHGQMAHGGLCHRSLLGIPDGAVQHGQERYDLERGDRRRLRHLSGTAASGSFPPMEVRAA